MYNMPLYIRTVKSEDFKTRNCCELCREEQRKQSCPVLKKHADNWSQDVNAE